jgi:hypothetical protein
VSALASPFARLSGRPGDPSLADVTNPWPTPRKLKAYRVAIWAIVALLFLFGESTLQTSRSAFKAIGKDTVPSIIAAQEIGYALADLDGNVANSLLGNAQHRQAAAAVIEKQRLRVTDSLVDAAQNITYGNAEKVPIRDMVRDLGRYLELMAQARFRYEQNDIAGATATYWTATDLLHKNLLVEAGDLDTANETQLTAAYRSGGRETEGAEIVVLLLGAILASAIFALQIFLFRKTRRVFSPALVAATLLALFFPCYLAFRFSAARESLRVAKEDAFDSIHSLVRARTLAYDANGDESRYLLDGGSSAGAHGYEGIFRSKVLSLTTTPTDAPPTLTQINARKVASKGNRATGLFWNELDNITFAGEREAATAMVSAFRDYMLIDARVRKLATAGHMAEAIQLAIGTGPDESNAAFDRFDAALAKTVEINRTAFDHEMDTTNSHLNAAEGVSVALSLLVAFLVWLGIRPRLSEYTA